MSAKPTPTRWFDMDDVAVIRVALALVVLVIVTAATLGAAWRVFHFVAGIGG